MLVVGAICRVLPFQCTGIGSERAPPKSPSGRDVVECEQDPLAGWVADEFSDVETVVGQRGRSWMSKGPSGDSPLAAQMAPRSPVGAPCRGVFAGQAVEDQHVPAVDVRHLEDLELPESGTGVGQRRLDLPVQQVGRIGRAR